MKKTLTTLVLLLAVPACIDPLPTDPMPSASDPPTSASADCDEREPGIDDPCDPGGGEGGGGTSYLPRNVANNWTSATCRNTALGGGDSDGDGLNDDCEYNVAFAFSPALKVDRRDDVSRDEYYVVMPGSGNKVMIFYAFGYHRDLGWNGIGDHNGDSEFVVFELMPAFESGKPWRLLRAYLSAHRNSRGESSETVTGGRMERDSEGRPRVWVAYKKHANYKSQSACNSGGYASRDSCDNNNGNTRFWVVRNGNLGQIRNRTYPSPPSCAVPSRTLSTSNKECYWSYGRFYGWQGGENGGGSTGYQDILYDFGFNGARAHING